MKDVHRTKKKRDDETNAENESMIRLAEIRGVKRHEGFNLKARSAVFHRQERGDKSSKKKSMPKAS